MGTFKKFENLSDFNSYITNTPILPEYNNNQSSQIRGGDWTGTESYEVAEMLFMHGDKEIAAEIKSGVIDTTKNSRRHKDVIECGVVGAAPHVPNYIAGRPNAMISIRRTNKRATAVTVIFNISVNAGVKAEDMKRNGITMLSAIKMLEDNGTRVNLYLADISVNYNRTGEIGWALKIKTAGQHLDILKTAYPLCNPSMLRRHSFKFTEVTKNTFHGSYGCAKYDTTNLCKETGIRNAVSVSLYEVNSNDAKTLAAKILEKASKLPH